jgi:hypothetical protein
MDRLTTFGSGAVLGGVAAALYLVVLTGSPGALLLVYLSQLPLFAAGLWLGIGAVLAAGISGSTAVLLAGGWSAAALFVMLNAAPAVLLVRQALLARTGPAGAFEWYPPGPLTAWLTGFGVAALGAAIFYLGGPSGIETSLSTMLAPALDQFAGTGDANREELMKMLALVTPGALATSWMVMTASNAILAQGVLTRIGKAWRPSPDLAALTLPPWLFGFLVAGVALLLLGGSGRFFGVNLLIALSVPFSLSGLAVLHTAARRLQRPQIPLTVFYVVATLFGWPLLLVAILGVLEMPLGLRRRLTPPGSFGGKIE